MNGIDNQERASRRASPLVCFFAVRRVELAIVRDSAAVGGEGGAVLFVASSV